MAAVHCGKKRQEIYVSEAEFYCYASGWVEETLPRMWPLVQSWYSGFGEIKIRE